MSGPIEVVRERRREGRAAWAGPIADWVERGDARPIRRLLDRELDGDGVPRTLDVSDWWPLLTDLAGALASRREGWPIACDARIVGLVRAALRALRPDGTTVFEAEGATVGRARAGALWDWAGRLSDPGLATVARWWFPAAAPGRRAAHSPPPLPAYANPRRPLAILRADWSARGDLVAVEQRAADSCRVEVMGLGRAWLGPGWGMSGEAGPTTTPRPLTWKTGPEADLFEWGFRSGPHRVTRTALLLRGRQVALLAQQVDGPAAPLEVRIGLAEGVEARPAADGRGLVLSAGRGRGSVRVDPVGLPYRPYPTDRGSFAAVGRELVLRQVPEPGRSWLPLLVSWRPGRRRPSTWRALTVAERSRVCPPGVAFAARVSWGGGESLVIYRSLGRPALRSFLGHQTSARFLVGLFTSGGLVKPLLKIED